MRSLRDQRATLPTGSSGLVPTGSSPTDRNAVTHGSRGFERSEHPRTPCVGHGLLIEGESPLRGLSEVTVSESSCMTARKCEMEAVYESQHRTKVNLGTGYVGWVSVRCITTPNIRSFPWSMQGECGETLLNLTPRELLRSGVSVGIYVPTESSGKANEGNDNCLTSIEKSDHLIVVSKPGNAGGAKGVTC